MSAKGNSPWKDYMFAEPKAKCIMKALNTWSLALAQQTAYFPA